MTHIQNNRSLECLKWPKRNKNMKFKGFRWQTMDTFQSEKVNWSWAFRSALLKPCELLMHTYRKDASAVFSVTCSVIKRNRTRKGLKINHGTRWPKKKCKLTNQFLSGKLNESLHMLIVLNYIYYIFKSTLDGIFQPVNTKIIVICVYVFLTIVDNLS